MKTKKILVILVILALVLSACSSSKKEEEAQATVNAMYTSVAQTLTVLTQEVTPVPTNTVQPATATLAPSATPTTAKTATQVLPTEIPCDGSTYVSDITIPDGTVMTPGQAFTKTWSIKNSGTCDWTTSYKMVFLSGNAMGGASTSLTTAIGSGHADNVSVAMVAPTLKGTYTGYWIMQNAAGKTFGEQVYVSITVSTSATATPTITVTPTPTSTVDPNVINTAIAETLAAQATEAAAQTATAAATP